MSNVNMQASNFFGLMKDAPTRVEGQLGGQSVESVVKVFSLCLRDERFTRAFLQQDETGDLQRVFAKSGVKGLENYVVAKLRGQMTAERDSFGHMDLATGANKLTGTQRPNRNAGTGS